MTMKHPHVQSSLTILAGVCLLAVSLLTGCTWSADSDNVKIRAGSGEHQDDHLTGP